MWRGRWTLLKPLFVTSQPNLGLLAQSWTTCKFHASVKHGCSKCNWFCTTLGVLRTYYTFHNQLNQLQHHGPSSLELLDYFDCVDDVSLEAMHLCDMGIKKRILEYIFSHEEMHIIAGVTLKPVSIRTFNSSVRVTKNYIFRFDFAREPRETIKDIPRFKSEEFQTYLHYNEVVLFKQYLSGSAFQRSRAHVFTRPLSCHPNDHAHYCYALSKFTFCFL